ncbi:MAG: protein-glutamine glutaminase family protein [Bdellovibrionota bacterium]
MKMILSFLFLFVSTAHSAPVANIETLAPTATVITPAQATTVFAHAKAQIPTNFTLEMDGCDERANLISRFLEKNYQIKNLIITGTGGTTINARWLPWSDQTIDWGHHVATLVAVKSNNALSWMVIDPTVFDSPVTVNQWMTKVAGPYPLMKFRASQRNLSDPYLDKTLAQPKLIYVHGKSPAAAESVSKVKSELPQQRFNIKDFNEDPGTMILGKVSWTEIYNVSAPGTAEKALQELPQTLRCETVKGTAFKTCMIYFRLNKMSYCQLPLNIESQTLRIRWGSEIFCYR